MVDLEAKGYVFFDLDGVMGDFFPHFRRRFYHMILIRKLHPLDINVDNYNNKKKIRDFVNACCEGEGRDFWISMPRTNVSNFYMKRLKDYSNRILFLTATPPTMTEAVAGKKIWLQNHFKIYDEDRIFFDENKENYAVINGNRNILVDDSKVNIDKFNANGGLGLWELGKRSVASYYIRNKIIPMLNETDSINLSEPKTIISKIKRPRIHRLDRMVDIWGVDLEELNILPEHCYTLDND
jgi:hypothetical protein